MPWSIAFAADYSKRQWCQLPTLTTGAATPFPACNTTISKPEKILVQAPSTNTNPVMVGPKTNFVGAPSTLPQDGSEGGFELQPGESLILPSRLISDWVAAGTVASGIGVIQILKILYMAGPG